MAVLTANNLGKDFGAETIFNNVTVEIPRGSRIALVGPNGAGKTTLLHILIGEQSASRGEVNPMKQLRVGFLPQRPELLGKHTLYEEALRAFDDLRERERELDALAEQMAAGDEDAIRKYGKKQEQFEEDGGYTYEGKIQTVLGGLGFDEDELQHAAHAA